MVLKWIENPWANIKRSTRGQARLDIALIEIALQVIGNQDHHRVGGLAASAVVITRRILFCLLRSLQI